MKRRALIAKNPIYGPRRFHNLHELVLFHNRGFPIRGDRYTSHHAGQAIYIVLLPNAHGRLAPFGKAPRGIVDELRLFLLGANMEVDDENLVIYSKRVYDCFGWFCDEDVKEMTDDLTVKVSENPYLKGLECITQATNPLGAHPLLAIPAFFHHNLGFLRFSAHLIVYNTTNNGTLTEVWLPKTAMYDLEGRQATFSTEEPSLDTSRNTHILLEKADDAGVKLSQFAGFVKPEAVIRHLALRADRAFNPRESTVFSMGVPVDSVLVSGKPSIMFERLKVDELIEELLSRQFTPDASMALTQFL